MPYKIENIKTETWRRIIEDLVASGFSEIYQYGGMDAGIDYNRCELMNPADDELIVFEWDNWTEGEIKAVPSMAVMRRLQQPTPWLCEGMSADELRRRHEPTHPRAVCLLKGHAAKRLRHTCEGVPAV